MLYSFSTSVLIIYLWQLKIVVFLTMKLNDFCTFGKKGFVFYLSISWNYVHNLRIDSQIIQQNFVYHHRISHRLSCKICLKWVVGENDSKQHIYQKLYFKKPNHTFLQNFLECYLIQLALSFLFQYQAKVNQDWNF